MKRPSTPTTDPRVLALARTLATERYDGQRLSDLSPTDQRDLLIDAADQINHYQERHA